MSPPPPEANRNTRRVTVATGIWMLSIFLSRVIGLVRESTFGHILGGRAEADLYNAAFVIPDFLNYLLAGGALSIVFIPIFAGHLERGDDDAGWRAFSVIGNVLTVVLAIFLPVLWFAAPWLVRIVAPGFDSAQSAELTALTRIVLPAQACHLLGGLLSAALQARDRHALPAAAPLLYTGCIVAFGWILGPSMGARGFAWGVVVGSLVGPLGLPLVGCVRMGMRWTPTLDLRHPDLRTYVWRSLPIMLGWSIVVVDDWLLIKFGTRWGEGAATTLKYAKNLMKVPMGVFGLATGVATYPTLARLVVAGRRDEASRTLFDSLKRMLVLALGAQVVLTSAGTHISTVIYGLHKMEPAQHQLLGTSLGVLSLGLWAWASQTVVARGFYAAGKMWLPTLAGTSVVVVAYPIYPLLLARFGVVGLALASSCAITLYVLVLLLLLGREYPLDRSNLGTFFGRALPAVAIGLAVGIGLRYGTGWDGPPTSRIEALWQGTLLGSAGGVAYLASAAIFRLPELDTVVSRIGSKLRIGR